MSTPYVIRVRRRPVLMVDADDTLWPCACFYENARRKMAERIHYYTGIGEKLAYELVLATSKVNVQQPDGFLRPALAKRLASAGYAACALTGTRVDTEGRDLEVEARNIADIEVWDAGYAIFPGALDLLSAYRESGWTVVITTKGDDAEQLKKLQKNGVIDVVDGWHITPHKTPAYYDYVLHYRLADRTRSFVVGDSLSSDVAPAQASGLRTVWITGVKTGADLPVAKDVVPEFAISSVLELPTVVPFDPEAVPPRAEAANTSS